MTYPLPDDPAVAWPEPIPASTAATDARAFANDAWESLRQGLFALSGDFGLLLVQYFGAGRFVGTDPAINQPITGTGLTIRIPNQLILVEGRPYLIDEPEPSEYQVITDVPANKGSGVDGFASIDADTGLLVVLPEHWFDTYPTTPPAGLMHIGRAITNASAVTGFTPSTVDGVGIIRPRGTGASGGGEGEGGVSAEYVDEAIAALTILFNAKLAALQSQITPGERMVSQPIDQLVQEHSITRRGVLDCEQELFGVAFTERRSQSANIGKSRGSGESSGPDFEGQGNVSKNSDGEFSP